MGVIALRGKSKIPRLFFVALVFAFVPLVSGFLSGCSTPPKRPLPKITRQVIQIWDKNEPKTAEKNYRQLLNHNSLSQEERLIIKAFIGRSLALQGDFSLAKNELKLIMDNPDGQSPHVRVPALIETGRVFLLQSEVDSAKTYFSKAYEVSQFYQMDYYTVVAAESLGQSEVSPKQRLQWTLKALEVAKKSEESIVSNAKGRLLTNVGWSYYEEEKFSLALEYLTQALQFFEDRRQPQRVNEVQWSQARVFRSKGDLKQALNIQQQLVQRYKNQKQSPGLVYEELGELHLQLGRRKQAQRYFAKAYDLLSKNPEIKKQTDRLARIRQLSR